MKRRAMQGCYCGRFMTLLAVIGAMWSDCSSQEITRTMETVATLVSPTPTPVPNGTDLLSPTDNITDTKITSFFTTLRPSNSDSFILIITNSTSNIGMSTSMDSIMSIVMSLPTVQSSEMTPTLVPSEMTRTLASSEMTPTLVSSEVTPTSVSSKVTPTLVSSKATPTLVSSEVTPALVSSEVTPTLVSSEVTPTLVSSEVTPTLVSSEMTSMVQLTSGEISIVTSTNAKSIASSEALSMVLSPSVTPTIVSSEPSSVVSSVTSTVPSLTPPAVSSETPSMVSSEPSSMVSFVTSTVSSLTPPAVSSETPSMVSSVTPTIVSSVTPTIVSSVTPTIVSSVTPTIVSSVTPTIVSSVTPTIVSSVTPSMVSSLISTSASELSQTYSSSVNYSSIVLFTSSVKPSMVEASSVFMTSSTLSETITPVSVPTTLSETTPLVSVPTTLSETTPLVSVPTTLSETTPLVSETPSPYGSSLLSGTPSPQPSVMDTTGTTSSTTTALSDEVVFLAVEIIGGIVVLVLLMILLILTCCCVRGCLRKRSRNVYLSASSEEKRAGLIELHSFTPLEKNSQDCLGSLPIDKNQMDTDAFTASLPHLSPISYSSQLVSEFSKLYETEESQLPLPLHGHHRGASQPSLGTSYLPKFPDASTSLAEPTRMALSLGMSMEELPSRLSSKSTTPPHSAHASTELKQQNSTGKLAVEGRISLSDRDEKKPSTEEEGKLKGEDILTFKARPTSPASSKDPEVEEMVPTPGSPRTERTPNVPLTQATTQQAVPKVRSLSGLTVITNVGADGISDKEGTQSTITKESAVSLLPTTSPPILASKDLGGQAPPPAAAAAVAKKATGKKLNLEALTSVTLPSAPQTSVPQGKGRSVSFAEPGKDMTRVARTSTVSNPSKMSDSPQQGSKIEDKPKTTRQLSRLEKLTSLDYIRASLRARKKKVSFSVADNKLTDTKKLDTKHPKESGTIYNRHTSFGRNSPPPMFSPSGEAYEEDVFSPEPLGAGHFTRHHSGHDAILGYPQLSQPVYMPAYGGFVQLSQTYYPPLSQGIPYPYVSNHPHPIQPDPFVYHDDLTPEDSYPEPGYSELDQHRRRSRDWSPDAYTDTSHGSERHDEAPSPDNMLEGGMLLAQRSPKRVFSPGDNPAKRPDTMSPEWPKLPSGDLDDSFRSPARLLNSDNAPNDSRELGSGTKPKTKPRVSWKPSVEYHSRTPDPDCEVDDDKDRRL